MFSTSVILSVLSEVLTVITYQHLGIRRECRTKRTHSFTWVATWCCRNDSRVWELSRSWKCIGMFMCFGISFIHTFLWVYTWIH